MSIRVVVADDQDLVRAGLAGLLGAAPDIEVVGLAENGQQAVEVVRSVKPDVVVMDIRMPVMDGIEATATISGDRELAATRILVLTTFDADQYVYAALRAGASGFLLKDTRAEALVEAVRVIAAGEALLAPVATRMLVERFASAPGGLDAPPQLESLTARELDVLRLLAKGLSNDEIAARLFITSATAKTHVSHVMTKLGARDRAQLVAWAFEWGVVRPGV